jgi:PAS domain S-box-containing protein
MEVALSKSENHYRLMFESNPNPMWIYDTKTLTFLSVNDSAIAHYGYSRDEFLDMTIKDIRPAEDVPSLLEATKRVTAGLRESGIWRHRKKDGTIIDVEILSHDLDVEGTPARVVLAQDITKRKRAEDELKKNRILLQNIIEGTSDAVYVKDRNGRYLLFNTAASRITGKRSEEVIGKDDTVLFPPEEARMIMEGDRRVMDAGKTMTYEEDLSHAGEKHIYLSTKGPLFDDDGSVIGLFGIARDITARKAAEKERERLILELNETLAKVKSLSGLLPICASCKKVRDDKGYWNQIEAYISEHSEAEFSHGLCPDCAQKLYGELDSIKGG